MIARTKTLLTAMTTNRTWRSNMKHTQKCLPIVGVATALALSASVSHAAPIFSENFEDDNIAAGAAPQGFGNQFNASTQTSNVLNPGGGNAWLSPVPAGIGTFGVLFNEAEATVDLVDTFEDNMIYTLTFTQFRRDDIQGDEVTAEIRTTGGMVLKSESFAAITDTDTFVTRTVQWTTNGGSEVGEAIQIALIDPTVGGFTPQVALDNITLDEAVPEPGSLALLGLGGLLIARRRRSA